MKSLQALTFASVALLTTTAGVDAAPFASLGDNSAIFVTATVRAQYQDNIFRLNDNPTTTLPGGAVVPLDDQYNKDYILTFTPGIELRLADKSAFRSRLNLSTDIVRYQKEANKDALNNELPSIRFTSSYATGRTDFNFNAGWADYATNSAVQLLDINPIAAPSLIEFERSYARAGVAHKYSSVATMRGGLEWNRTLFTETGTARNLFGNSAISVPLTLLYKVNPTTDLTLGYRFRETEVINSDTTYTDNYVSVGVEGQLLSPALTGRANFGYQMRDVSEGSDVDNMAADVGLTYVLTPQISFNLEASRDFRVSSSPIVIDNNGTTTSRTTSIIDNRISLSSSYRINTMHSVHGGVAYGWNSYEDSNREQNTLFLNAGYRYQPNEYVSLSANYTYENVDGEGDLHRKYDANVISVSAALRY